MIQFTTVGFPALSFETAVLPRMDVLMLARPVSNVVDYRRSQFHGALDQD